MFQPRFLFLPILIIIVFLSTSCQDESSTPMPTDTISTPTEETLTEIEPTPTTIEATPTKTEPISTTTEPISTTIEETPTPLEAIAIGSHLYTEQLLGGKILFFTLERAGYEVVDKTGLGATDTVREALENGEIDLYWEFSGSALTGFHEVPSKALPTDPNRSYELIKSLDYEKFGLVWLDPVDIIGSYTLMVQPSMVEQGIVTLEDLADLINTNQVPVTLCVDAEFYDRPDGLSALQSHYDFKLKEENIEIVEFDQSYQYLRDGRCNVAEGISTDARISAWGFHRLEDSQQFFSVNVPAPVTRADVLDKYPELPQLLAGISANMDLATFSQLNALVKLGPDGEPDSGDEKSVDEVARCAVYGCPPPSIVVGGGSSSEHIFLGKVLLLLLKDIGYQVVDKTDLGSTNAVREALLAGEIDVYWEIISTALTNFHPVRASGVPADPDRALALLQDRDKPLDLVWLNRANFDTTYALVTNPTTMSEIQTLEELATFMNENDAPLRVCVEQQFEILQEGLHGMEEFYEFKFKEENIVRLSAYETYQGLQEGKCDVAQGLTMGSHEAYGFRILEDSKRFFLPLSPAPVIRKEILDQNPKLAELLTSVGRYLDGVSVEELNRRIEVGDDGVPNSGDEESPEAIARLVLCEAGMLKECATMAEPDEETGEETDNLCQNIVMNGDFEGDGNWELPGTALPAEYSTERFHSGERAMRLGLTEGNDRVSHSVARQRVVIPQDATTATLSYWYYPISSELDDGNDVQGGQIYHTESNSPQGEFLRVASNEQAWVLDDYDLSDFIGQEVILYFYVDNDDDGQPSAMYVDDVSVQVCTGSP